MTALTERLNLKQKIKKANGRKTKALVDFVLVQLIKCLTAFVGIILKATPKRAQKTQKASFA